MAPRRKQSTLLDQSVLHVEDFGLVEGCIEGDQNALLRLQAEYGPNVVGFLMRSGADISQAEEIVNQLWADLVTAPPGESPKLARYDGSCRLATWLNTVAVNRLMSARRSQKRRDGYIATSIDAPVVDEDSERTFGSQIPAPAIDSIEPPLIELLRGAIQNAFASCPAETFVLLQLAHGDGLRLRELGQIWGCNPSTLSRRLDQATSEIARSVLAHVRAADPMLELTWSDFRQLCATVNLGALGFD
jgi:RNA polymerase sigma factor (sigma-70 family)